MEDSTLAGSRISYCWGTVVMLVALRLVIGGHFFIEGAKHVTDPNWTSEGFLRQAKGPLAEAYQGVLPDLGGWNELMQAELPTGDVKTWSKPTQVAWEKYRKQLTDYDKLPEEQQAIERAIFRWQTAMSDGWKADSGWVSGVYNLTDEQKAEAETLVERRQEELRDLAKQNHDALAAHIHDARRLNEWRAAKSANDVPYQKKRIAEISAKLNGEAAAWLAQLKALDRDLQHDLADVRDDIQKRRGEHPREPSQLRKVDMWMKYTILAIGGCLIVGLFTRLAAFAGAAFLASVALTQPFWLPDAAPTYPQVLEMLALLTLATTPVGRWGGLDFLLHHVVGRCCCSTKGKLT